MTFAQVMETLDEPPQQHIMRSKLTVDVKMLQAVETAQHAASAVAIF
jgi:hypothetical protein